MEPIMDLSQFDYLKINPHIVETVTHQDFYIKRGKGAEGKRRIFYNQKYDQYESSQIALVQQKIDFASQEDILKFLYQQTFDIDKTVNALQEYKSWISQKENYTLYDKSKKLITDGIIYLGGRDRQFRPTLIIQANKLDFQNEELWKHFQIALCHLILIMKHRMLFPGKIESWNIIIETMRSTFFNFPFGDVKKFITFITNLFPSYVETIFILNPSKTLQLQWSIIEDLDHLNVYTKKKITFLSSEEYKKLIKTFPSSQLEQKFGGTLKNIDQFYLPINTSIIGIEKDDLDKFKQNIEQNQKNINLIKRKSCVFVDQLTQTELKKIEKPKNKRYVATGTKKGFQDVSKSQQPSPTVSSIEYKNPQKPKFIKTPNNHGDLFNNLS